MRASKRSLWLFAATVALVVGFVRLDVAAAEDGQSTAAPVKIITIVNNDDTKDAPEECECADGECKDDAAIDGKVAVATKTDAKAGNDPKEDLVRPTHKQTTVISVNSANREDTVVNSFCLSPEGNVMAACGNGPGEVRVFDKDGAYLSSFELAVRPDAINIGSDGNIYIAGGGRLLQLDPTGHVLHETESPHAAKLLASKDQLRKEIIQQNKDMGEQFKTQVDQYDKLIAELKKTQDEKVKAGQELSKSDKRRLESFEQMKEQYETMAKQMGSAKELTDKELDGQVKSSLEYKLRVASISQTGDDVFVACCAAAGYGFDIWRLDREFKNGKIIVSDLSGCCGQMDVQASTSGIYVAENSRHRVCCYDRDGKMTASWGKQARNGLDGFGSCCNPMNVAFGPDGSIYTAESEIGRVKRFSPKGELIDLVGKVDIVPGCKKVAIAVSKEGDNVYMLDVSRHHIVKMERLAPGEKIAYAEHRGESAAAEGGSTFGSALLQLITGQ
jgi:sugar lactone lactonase YvrE